jgi:hypothetical protein
LIPEGFEEMNGLLFFLLRSQPRRVEVVRLPEILAEFRIPGANLANAVQCDIDLFKKAFFPSRQVGRTQVR